MLTGPAEGAASFAGAAADWTPGRPSGYASTVWFPPGEGFDSSLTSGLAVEGESEYLLNVMDRVVIANMKTASPAAAAAERRLRRAQMRGNISLKS
jgi:hypothetical protein